MAHMKQPKEPPLVLMTHPNGQPLEIREHLVEGLIKRGYKLGYTKPKAKANGAK